MQERQGFTQQNVSISPKDATITPRSRKAAKVVIKLPFPEQADKDQIKRTDKKDRKYFCSQDQQRENIVLDQAAPSQPLSPPFRINLIPMLKEAIEEDQTSSSRPSTLDEQLTERNRLQTQALLRESSSSHISDMSKASSDLSLNFSLECAKAD